MPCLYKKTGPRERSPNPKGLSVGADGVSPPMFILRDAPPFSVSVASKQCYPYHLTGYSNMAKFPLKPSGSLFDKGRTDAPVPLSLEKISLITVQTAVRIDTLRHCDSSMDMGTGDRKAPLLCPDPPILLCDRQ
jgi:hypothetical protein